MQGGEHAPQEFAKVSSRIQENSRFPETHLGDQRISPLRAKGGSEFAPFSDRSAVRHARQLFAEINLTNSMFTCLLPARRVT
jgi:hypothetical protein